MNQKLTIGIFVVIAALIGGYVLYTSGNDTPASPVPPAPTPAAAPIPAPSAVINRETHAVSMDTNGFTPPTTAIKAGDTVVFKNDDTRSRWPASGIHPTHLLCPGFDAQKPMQPGETYSHTFTEAKECPMHDHLMPRLKGAITVVP